MPKYDAFGREIGEDTLEGLGGTPDATRRPAPLPVDPEPQPAAPRAAVPRAQPSGPEAPVAPQAPDATARRALAAQLRNAMAQGEAARSSAAPAAIPVARRSTARRGCFVAFAVMLVMAVLAIAGGVLLVGSVGTDSGGPPATIRIPAEKPAKPAAAPRGLGPRSLARKANFAAALRKLSGPGLRLTQLRLAPERIDATLLTRGGRLRHVQLQPGGTVERFGPDSGPGFDSSSTIPFGRVRPGAPERLARQGAAKLRVPVSTVQYLVPNVFGGKVTWAAYFKHSRYVIGDAAGRWQRSYP